MRANVENRSFQTTRWSLIERLSEGTDSDAEIALAELCGSYRAPLLSYAMAHYPNDAEDLVHGFFERMIENRVLHTADPEKGNLRNFLLSCFKRHIANHFRNLHAIKRGGSIEHVAIQSAAEVVDPAADVEALYHRRWAQEVLEHAIGRLRESWNCSGKGRLFEEVHPFLGFQRNEEERQSVVAERLGMSTGALKTQIYRMRIEYRETLLIEIGRTLKVKNRDEVMMELKDLMWRF